MEVGWGRPARNGTWFRRSLSVRTYDQTSAPIVLFLKAFCHRFLAGGTKLVTRAYCAYLASHWADCSPFIAQSLVRMISASPGFALLRIVVRAAWLASLSNPPQRVRNTCNAASLRTRLKRPTTLKSTASVRKATMAVCWLMNTYYRLP